MDDGYTERQGILHAGDPDRPPVKQNVSLVRGEYPGQDSYQGRLPGAVLSDQAADLPRVQLQVYLVERKHPGEPLCDALHEEQR